MFEFYSFIWTLSDFLKPLAFIGFIIMFFSFCMAVLFHVLNALALFSLAKNNGYENIAILAWIPFVNLYLVGVLSGGINFLKIQKIPGSLLGILLAVLPFTMNKIPVIGLIMWILLIILTFQALFNFYSRIDQSVAILMAILGVIPFTVPITIIYLFVKRNTILDQSYEVY